MTINRTSFYNLKNHPEYTYQLKSDFREQVKPLYGNQDQDFQKIIDGTDRECELLIDEVSKKLLAITVYKTDPTMKYDKYGIENALGLKILFADPISSSGKGRGSKLEKRTDEVVKEKLHTMELTASGEKIESLQLFVQKDLILKSVFLIEGIAEFLFARKV